MLPPAITEILYRIEACGAQAYLVGGCVRDMLLKRPIHDWDIATSLYPRDIMRLFPHTVPTGLAHGTVTVLYADTRAEITTFRADGAYADGRHPEQVRFVPSLREDLARRDFTINAMAMDARGVLYDYFDGKKDLAGRCIRCVGSPERRFSEDALRMLRAIRFAAQLGFCLDAGTREAIRSCRDRVRLLSVERIRDEIEKTLCSDRPELCGRMAEYGLLERFGVSCAADSALLKELEPDACVRWSAFMVLYPVFQKDILRLSRSTQHIAARSAQLYALPVSKLALKRVIASDGMQVAWCLACLHRAQTLFRQIVASGECVQLSQLAVKGTDLPMLKGRQIGQRLERMLAFVLEHPECNDRDFLLKNVL